ncbi:baseplate hub protein [Limnohabitans sp.]|uniref:baseplate hub protein n=1 Tax=Limnohabitans sp. TaxID=1907725 RepID=UPI00286FA627|nr:hypothetical protein [Limnohabitans sp.]
MQELDPRVIRVTIEVQGETTTLDTRTAVSFCVTKTANPLMNEAEIRIANLPHSIRDHLLTQLTPWVKLPRKGTVMLEVGRVSTGLTKLFQGSIVSAMIGQPPDIVVALKCKTGYYFNATLCAVSHPACTNLSAICKQTADSMGLSMIFEATDKQIANYNHTGPMGAHVRKIAESGGVTAFVDDNELVVTNEGEPRKVYTLVVNAETGMIGVPMFTEQGLQCKMLLDTKLRIGGKIEVTSKANPAVNGTYTAFKIQYEGANRDTPWYMTASTMPPRSVMSGNLTNLG